MKRLLRRWARRVLRGEIHEMTADLAIARADIRDALAVNDEIRAQLARWAGYVDQTEAAKCTKVPLHSGAECEAWAAQIQARTGDFELYESYECRVCPRHPLVGPILHMRHVRRADRGRSGRQSTAERRRGRPLNAPIDQDRLVAIRDRLTASEPPEFTDQITTEDPAR